MKGKKKNKLLILAIIGIVIIGAVAFIFGFNYKNVNSLSLEENKWIDENKQNVIDIAILNDISILSYEGSGMVYNYLDYITDNHSLKFNVVSYKLDLTMEYDYKMDLVDKVTDDDIEILRDNYILLTANDKQYADVSNINNLKIGVLSSDLKQISGYLNNETISYVEYSSYSDLKGAIIDTKTAINEGKQEYAVDAIIVLKTAAIKEIIENNLNVAFHFNDLKKSFVITTKGNKYLNSIFNKTFNSWKAENYKEKYNEYLLENYYSFKKLSDVEQKTLKSKNYVYGFVNYGIYNHLDGNDLIGINGLILKDFNEFSKLAISYTRYNSITKLIKDFNANKVDFMFELVNENQFEKNIYKTKEVLDKKIAIVSGNSSNLIIDSLNSLKGKEVLVLKNSYIEDYLKSNEIKSKAYNNLDDLVKDFNSNDILLIDLENYNFYKSSYLKDSRLNYIFSMNDGYNFIINDKDSNKLFEDIFDFYLSFNSINKLITTSYEDIAYQSINIVYILLIIIAVLFIYVILDFNNHVKVMLKTIKKNKKDKLTKEEKIMYIDQLTSLKNRTYFNSKIESWDESEVYPQSIIVIDLNNVSYVNDNYGREEGDKVITEAANILIQHQLANSEIIRTDGNEFLIYLVGYTEKQIISYLRKLSKEFKNLSHGFGAASGYSIITDAIKTIDDAVNEATLAMKENKEDIDY